MYMFVLSVCLFVCVCVCVCLLHLQCMFVLRVLIYMSEKKEITKLVTN